MWRLGGAAPCGELSVAENNRARRKDLSAPRHHQPLQKSLKRSDTMSVYRTVCWMFLCQGPRVVAVAGELEPASMAKHVWVESGMASWGLADAPDEAVKTDGTDWTAALGNPCSNSSVGASARPASR